MVRRVVHSLLVLQQVDRVDSLAGISKVALSLKCLVICHSDCLPMRQNRTTILWVLYCELDLHGHATLLIIPSIELHDCTDTRLADLVEKDIAIFACNHFDPKLVCC